MYLSLIAVLLIAAPLSAVPTFQVYIEGAVPGDFGPDEDSWLIMDNTFNLVTVGAYGKKTLSLTEATLTLCVPQGETGTISITGGDGATLLTSRTKVPGTEFYNPDADADIAVLSDVPGNTGYKDKNFLPTNVTFNNHYPFQDGVSDFVIYGIGDFANLGPVHNYNADEGSITEEGYGQEKVFEVTVDGFSWVHFDLYGYQTLEDGSREFNATWLINPSSHDATFTPAPGAVLLAGVGVFFVGWLHSRRTL
jgi:hypothetical protein